MAGTVHIPFYATLFRGDKLEAALEQLVPISLRYGASWCVVHRSRDDAYKFLFQATFDDKSDWVRFWDGPECIRFRAANSGYYQVPIVYYWNDVVAEGRFVPRSEPAPEHAAEPAAADAGL